MNTPHRMMMLLAVALYSLAGCQLLPSSTSAVGSVKALDDEISLTCGGSYHCEFGKLNEILLVDTTTHRPANPRLLEEAEPKLHPEARVRLGIQQSNTASGHTQYYVRALPGRHELQLALYPEANDQYAETVTLIHHFAEPGHYHFRAYRQARNEQSGSLLDTASPAPLCVALNHEGQVLRKFCKLPKADGFDEFVEIDRTK